MVTAGPKLPKKGWRGPYHLAPAAPAPATAMHLFISAHSSSFPGHIPLCPVPHEERTHCPRAAMCIIESDSCSQAGGTPDGFLPVVHAPQGALGACADARAARRRSPGGKSWAPIGRGSSWSSRFGGAGRNGRKRAAAFGPDGDDAPRRSTRAPQAQAPGAAVSAGRCEHHATGGDRGHPAEGCTCASFAAEGCGNVDSVGAGVSAADQGRHQSFEAQSPGAGRALCDTTARGTSRSRSRLVSIRIFRHTVPCG